MIDRNTPDFLKYSSAETCTVLPNFGDNKNLGDDLYHMGILDLETRSNASSISPTELTIIITHSENDKDCNKISLCSLAQYPHSLFFKIVGGVIRLMPKSFIPDYSSYIFIKDDGIGYILPNDITDDNNYDNVKTEISAEGIRYVFKKYSVQIFYYPSNVLCMDILNVGVFHYNHKPGFRIKIDSINIF